MILRFVNLYQFVIRKKMIQEILIYVLLATALAYVGYRIYDSIKKKHACDKCGLMEAAKEAKKK